MKTGRPANLTRRTPDLAGKLRREGRYGFLSLYHLLRLSDFGREGIERSGSFRFADHLYANRASGRGVMGWIIDRVLLSLPAARAMRQRCTESTATMRQAYSKYLASGHGGPFRLLTVPCGLPRDVRDFAKAMRLNHPTAIAGIEYTGLDLDPAVLIAARAFLGEAIASEPRWLEGDALDAGSFPESSFHFIGSTGLGEFLDDEQILRLYANVHGHLAPGGVFYTSATAREPRSDAMLRAFELHTHYRTRAELEPLLRCFPWREVEYTHDRTGLQTFVRATKA